MYKIFLPTILLSALLLAGASFAQEAITPPELRIAELATASAASASDEFVELYNPSFRPADLSGIELQYRSAGGSTWTAKARLAGSVPPKGRYLIASAIPADASMGSGLAAAGGAVRLASGDTILDTVAWGTAPDAAAPAPDNTQSLKLQPDEDGLLGEAYVVSQAPSPRSDVAEWLAVQEEVPAEPEESPAEEDEAVPAPVSQEPSPPVSAPAPAIGGPAEAHAGPPVALLLHALLPDPAAPLTDRDDESVSIHNPTAQTAYLHEYQLEIGTTRIRAVRLPERVLGPGQTATFYSSELPFALSNGGTTVRLVHNGETELDAVSYEKARPGQTLRRIDAETWAWSGAAGAVAGAAKRGSGAGRSGSASGGSGSRKSVAVRSPAGSSEGEGREVYQEPAEVSAKPLDPNVLVGVGGLALLYVAYEYRTDIGGVVRLAAANLRNCGRLCLAAFGWRRS